MAEVQQGSIKTNENFGDEKGYSERSSGWCRTSAVILADSVGTGVLSLSRAMAQLGWGPGLACLGLSAPLFWLAGYLLMHVHLYAPDSRTYGDFARALSGPSGSAYLKVLVYAMAFGSMGSYMLTIAQNMQGIFYDSHLCLPVAAVVAFLLLLPGLQLRSLHLIAPHAMASFAALLVVIVIALYFLFSDGASCTNAPPAPLDFWGLFNAMGSFVWAFAGVSYYPEMMAEMKRPQDFAKKSLSSAILIMASLYALVSITTYGKCGSGTPESLVSVIPQGPWLRIASVLMVYHVAITYFVNSQVLVSGIVCTLGLKRAMQPGFYGRGMWFGISGSLSLVAILVASAVPQFGNLNDFIGNACCTQGCLLLPPLFFLLVQRVAPWEPSALRSALVAFAFPMMAFGLFQFSAGTVSSVEAIWDGAHTDDAHPFACQALG